MEPKFAAAGCAVVSNSSAFRMAPNVPLVIPEVNADHLHLIEEQPWRKESGGYMVTNPNCSTIGLVMALKPIEERFGIEQIFVTTMQAISGAGYPGVASMDILGNVIPYIGNEEEKMEAETLKLLGRLDGSLGGAARREDERALQPRCGGRRPHRERLASSWATSWPPRHPEDILAAWAEFNPLAGQNLPMAPEQPIEWAPAGRSSAAASRPQSRPRHGRHGGTPASLRSARLEIYRAVAQHGSRRRRSGDSERRTAGQPRQARARR